jgi:N-acetylmuramoyl-L-alanine amidase
MTAGRRKPDLKTGRLALRLAGAGVYVCLLLLATLAGTAAARADTLAQLRASARTQFARAEALRASLEAKPERQRSLEEYTDLVASYRRVYLITPNAAEVPAAIKQVADLYEHMGEQFEPKYFREARTSYEFLAHDYPGSRYVAEAQLAIAALERGPLNQPDLAKAAYEDFLQHHPKSSHAAEVRKALAEMEAEETEAADASGAAPSKDVRTVAAATVSREPRTPTTPDPAANDNTAPTDVTQLGQVRVWNRDTYARVIIGLGDQEKYQAARISHPDRIYFDIENSHVDPQVAKEAVKIPSNGYLKSVRVAQNQPDVVRVVLEVNKVKDYSIFKLENPNRLVVDVYGSEKPTDAEPPATTTTARPATPRAKEASAASSAPASPASSDGAGTSAPASATSKGKKVAAERTPKSKATAPPESAATEAHASAEPTPKPPLLSPKKAIDSMGPAPVAQPTRAGERSLSRVLGLKIGRIVIDPGHGGHDTGTIGPTGLMEKDLALDVALRLGRIIQQNLPLAEVSYTRSDDRFVGLEQRTEIANDARSDLLISIHANSSKDHHVRGIETYYLNFNAAPGAMEVAARENAATQGGVHQLQEMVEKIARNDKIEESRELAEDVQDALTRQTNSRSSARNRGVRKAPFVVLIGAHMPSILTEISFLSNPSDEQWLKKPQNRQKIAEGIYHGIENYLKSTNSLAGNLNPGRQAGGSPGQSTQ